MLISSPGIHFAVDLLVGCTRYTMVSWKRVVKFPVYMCIGNVH